MKTQFDRRSFARLLGLTATAATLPTVSLAAPPQRPASSLAFPEGFLWGSATAS